MKSSIPATDCSLNARLNDRLQDDMISNDVVQNLLFPTFGPGMRDNHLGTLARPAEGVLGIVCKHPSSSSGFGTSREAAKASLGNSATRLCNLGRDVRHDHQPSTLILAPSGRTRTGALRESQWQENAWSTGELSRMKGCAGSLSDLPCPCEFFIRWSLGQWPEVLLYDWRWQYSSVRSC